jgi:putative flippase GtrA
MKKRIFKNENSLFGRLESLIRFWWEKSFIRFVVVGGFNTLLGIVVISLLRYAFDNLIGYNPKWDFVLLWFLNLQIDIPGLIMFVGLLPVSYSTQALWAFRTKWSWKRLAIYPLSSIPNFILQQGFIYLFEVVLGVNEYVSYVLAGILPIPIMFFIIRFLVKPKQKAESGDPAIEEKTEN